MPILELLLAFPFGLTSYRWKVQIKSSHARVLIALRKEKLNVGFWSFLKFPSTLFQDCGPCQVGSLSHISFREH